MSSYYGEALKQIFTFWGLVNKSLTPKVLFQSGRTSFSVKVFEVVNQTSENQYNAKLLYDLYYL